MPKDETVAIGLCIVPATFLHVFLPGDDRSVNWHTPDQALIWLPGTKGNATAKVLSRRKV
jgi:hypothetical protein